MVNGSNTGVDCSRVNMMGIEDPYGWQWEFLQGVFCGSSNNSSQSGTEIFIYKGNRLPTTAELAAHPMVNTDKLPVRQLPVKCRK